MPDRQREQDAETIEARARRRRRRARHVRAIAAAALVAGLVPAGLAQAADTTAPVVKVKTPAFIKGTVLTTNNWSGDPADPSWYSYIGGTISWSATDASGICGYSLYAQPAGSEPYALFVDQKRTSYTVSLDEYDGSYGGGSMVTSSWFVTATDCAGNVSKPKHIGAGMQAIQDDGSTSLMPRGSLAYSGAWSVSTCTCWSALTTRKTTQKNASATFSAQFAAGDRVGLVMATGPDRGRFQVLVDGKLKATVDTRAAVNANRTLVWQGAIGAGTHTIKIVNLATPGRPRIDLDAILLN